MKTDYNQQVAAFLTETETTIKKVFVKNTLYFDDDTITRDIWKITLRRGTRSFSFQFGQSLTNEGKEPTDYGYNQDSVTARKVYKAVKKQAEALQRLFTAEELEALQEIN